MKPIKDFKEGNIIVHPEYVPNSKVYSPKQRDLAIVKLKAGLKSDFVLPNYSDFSGAMEQPSQEHILVTSPSYGETHTQKADKLLMPMVEYERYETFEPSRHHASEVQNYWDFSMELKAGFSGAPIFTIDRLVIAFKIEVLDFP